MAFRDQKKEEERPPAKLLGIRVSALVEIASFFFIMFLISLFFGLDFNFFSASPHPFWIVVVLISTQYGTTEGLIAALSAFLIFLLGPYPERTILQETFVYFSF